MFTTALKGRRVLYISYNGMLDPLGQSQVIPYLRELGRVGVGFTLLSFERAQAWEGEGLARREELQHRLAEDNIDWHYLRYHQKPSLPATIYDVLLGVRVASKLVRQKKIELVHARSHIPATIALALKKRFHLKMIFDVRGLMAEEYLDAGHWRERSIPFRLSKRMERRALAASDGVVTLTHAIWPIMKEWDGLRGRDVVHEVVPCCVDLEKFGFDLETRRARRAELNLRDRFTLVYSGSIGGWYLMDEMADFFLALRKHRPDAHFLWLTQGNRSLVDNLMSKRGIGQEHYTVRATASGDVPAYLSASDLGIAFYKPAFSRLATSPVKITEYLACGLPIVLNKGIGDSAALITEERLGALVNDFTTDNYQSAANVVLKMLDDVDEVRSRARHAAEKLFDVRTIGLQRYADLYERVLSS
jgi:glycosyltransferase involved in cell wall biosynthesis